MEKRLILRGLGVGALGGLLAFLFARVMAEPMVQKAIDYESGRDAAQDALRRAAGLTVEPAGDDIFSRGVQRNVGIGVGVDPVRAGDGRSVRGRLHPGPAAHADPSASAGAGAAGRRRRVPRPVPGPLPQVPDQPARHRARLHDRRSQPALRDHGRRLRRGPHRGGRRRAQAVAAPRGLERDAAGRRGVRGADRRGRC